MLRIGVEREETKEEDREEGGARFHRQERSRYFTGRALRMSDKADLQQLKVRVRGASCGWVRHVAGQSGKP